MGRVEWGLVGRVGRRRGACAEVVPAGLLLGRLGLVAGAFGAVASLALSGVRRIGEQSFPPSVLQRRVGLAFGESVRGWVVGLVAFAWEGRARPGVGLAVP